MGYDYEALYKQTPHALGEPAAVIVDFFDRYDQESARILDVGCGQGRDALFLACRGHDVTGVDVSPSGVADMVSDAAREAQEITGVVADINDYEPEGEFDVILIDRTLHMLSEVDRIRVLTRLILHSKSKTWLLILDEPKNITAFNDLLASTKNKWVIVKHHRGTLFAQREG